MLPILPWGLATLFLRRSAGWGHFASHSRPVQSRSVKDAPSLHALLRQLPHPARELPAALGPFCSPGAAPLQAPPVPPGPVRPEHLPPALPADAARCSFTPKGPGQRRGLGRSPLPRRRRLSSPALSCRSLAQASRLSQLRNALPKSLFPALFASNPFSGTGLPAPGAALLGESPLPCLHST